MTFAIAGLELKRSSAPATVFFDPQCPHLLFSHNPLSRGKPTRLPVQTYYGLVEFLLRRRMLNYPAAALETIAQSGACDEAQWERGVDGCTLVRLGSTEFHVCHVVEPEPAATASSTSRKRRLADPGATEADLRARGVLAEDLQVLRGLAWAVYRGLCTGQIGSRARPLLLGRPLGRGEDDVTYVVVFNCPDFNCAEGCMPPAPFTVKRFNPETPQCQLEELQPEDDARSPGPLTRLMGYEQYVQWVLALQTCFRLSRVPLKVFVRLYNQYFANLEPCPPVAIAQAMDSEGWTLSGWNPSLQRFDSSSATWSCGPTSSLPLLQLVQFGRHPDSLSDVCTFCAASKIIMEADPDERAAVEKLLGARLVAAHTSEESLRRLEEQRRVLDKQVRKASKLLRIKRASLQETNRRKNKAALDLKNLQAQAARLQTERECALDEGETTLTTVDMRLPPTLWQNAHQDLQGLHIHSPKFRLVSYHLILNVKHRFAPQLDSRLMRMLLPETSAEPHRRDALRAFLIRAVHSGRHDLPHLRQIMPRGQVVNPLLWTKEAETEIRKEAREVVRQLRGAFPCGVAPLPPDSMPTDDAPARAEEVAGRVLENLYIAYWMFIVGIFDENDGWGQLHLQMYDDTRWCPVLFHVARTQWLPTLTIVNPVEGHGKKEGNNECTLQTVMQTQVMKSNAGEGQDSRDLRAVLDEFYNTQQQPAAASAKTRNNAAGLLAAARFAVQQRCAPSEQSEGMRHQLPNRVPHRKGAAKAAKLAAEHPAQRQVPISTKKGSPKNQPQYTKSPAANCAMEVITDNLRPGDLEEGTFTAALVEVLDKLAFNAPQLKMRRALQEGGEDPETDSMTLMEYDVRERYDMYCSDMVTEGGAGLVEMAVCHCLRQGYLPPTTASELLEVFLDVVCGQGRESSETFKVIMALADPEREMHDGILWYVLIALHHMGKWGESVEEVLGDLTNQTTILRGLVGDGLEFLKMLQEAMSAQADVDMKLFQGQPLWTMPNWLIEIQDLYQTTTTPPTQTWKDMHYTVRESWNVAMRRKNNDDKAALQGKPDEGAQSDDEEEGDSDSDSSPRGKIQTRQRDGGRNYKDGGNSSDDDLSHISSDEDDDFDMEGHSDDEDEDAPTTDDSSHHDDSDDDD